MDEQAIIIGRSDVAAILTAHADDLRTLNFELIQVPDKNELEANLMYCHVNQEELLTIGSVYDINYLEDPLEELRSEYSHLDKLLSFKPNHMVCAGGAITSSLIQYDERERGDADIFFYDLDSQEAENLIREIFQWVQKEKPGLWYGLRNQNVTTLWICQQIHRADLDGMLEKDRPKYIMNEGEKYQFIHRVFPSKASVIGGFDISACMFLYDGFEIYGLPISLFALKSGFIIADLSRRSPSFEMRLKKYANRYGFGIIVPCMSNGEIKKFASESPFDFGTARFGASVTVGGCLRVIVFDGGNRVALAKRLYRSQQTDVSDYDAGKCDYSKLATVNSISALQGKVSLLSWGGSSLRELFTEAHIPYLSEDVLSKKFDDISSHAQRYKKELSTMCRWFGPDRCYKEGTSIKKADFPDVCFKEEELPAPLNKKKKNKRKQKGSPIGNKTGVLKLPEEFHKFAYEDGDKEYNQRWPALTQREISIAKSVIVSRCNAFQASMQDRWLTRSMVTWIEQNNNPGRQFTASFNPITEVSSWYNPKMSRPLFIGIPHKVFIQLKLLSLYGSNRWFSDFTMIREHEYIPAFPRDVLKLICRSLWQLYAEEGRSVLKKRLIPRMLAEEIQYEENVLNVRELNLEVIRNCAEGELGDGEHVQNAKRILEHVDDVEDFQMHFTESTAEYLNRLWEQISRTISNREKRERYNKMMADGEAARQRYLEEHAEEIAKTTAFNAKMLARIPKHLTESVSGPENPWMGMGATRWMELCDEYRDEKEEPTVATTSEDLEEDEIPELVEFLDESHMIQTRDPCSPRMMPPLFRMMKDVKAVDLASPEQSDDDWPGVAEVHVKKTNESNLHPSMSDRERGLRILDRLSEKQKAEIVDSTQPWIDLERKFGSSDGEDEEDCSEESEEQSDEDDVRERAKKLSMNYLYGGLTRVADYRVISRRESYAEPEEDDANPECLLDGVQTVVPFCHADEMQPCTSKGLTVDQFLDYSKNITEQGDMFANRYSQMGIIGSISEDMKKESLDSSEEN